MKTQSNEPQRGERGAKFALIFLLSVISLGLLSLAARLIGLF